MSQQFTSYVSKGMQESKYAFKRRKHGFMNLLTFFMASLIGKRFFLSYPLFALAEYHLAQQVEQEGVVSLEEAFEDACITKNYWTAVHLALLNQVVFLIGFFTIALFGFVLFFFGTMLEGVFGFGDNIALVVSLTVTAGLFLMLIIQKSLYFGPVLYLIQGSDVSLSEALQQSRHIMTKSARYKLLRIHMYYFSKTLLVIGAVVAITYFAAASYPAIPWLVLMGMGFIVVLMSFAPKTMFSHRISTSKLFIDLVQEAIYYGRGDSDTSKLATQKVSKEKLLLSVFEKMIKDKQMQASFEQVRLDETGVEA